MQFDIAGTLGLPDGRYLVRAAPAAEVEAPTDEPTRQERVLVIQSLAVPPKLKKRPGKRPGKSAEPPGEGSVSRVTAVFAEQAFTTEKPAQEWMRRTADDEDAREEAVTVALGMLNRALHALAVAVGDPYIGEVGPTRPLAVRIGQGLGPELAEGNFSACIDLPTGNRRRRRRTDSVGPQERVAAILGGRQQPDVCETFVMRARADLTAGRDREAALGLSIALDTLLIELEGALSDPAHLADLGLLQTQRPDAHSLADRARVGEIDAGDRDRVDDLISVCERVLRRRRILRG